MSSHPAGVTGAPRSSIHAERNRWYNAALDIHESSAFCGASIVRLGGDPPPSFDPTARNSCQRCVKHVGGAGWKP